MDITRAAIEKNRITAATGDWVASKSLAKNLEKPGRPQALLAPWKRPRGACFQATATQETQCNAFLFCSTV